MVEPLATLVWVLAASAWTCISIRAYIVHKRVERAIMRNDCAGPIIAAIMWPILLPIVGAMVFLGGNTGVYGYAQWCCQATNGSGS